MGVFGLWSLISNDPRRFGEAWICHKDASLVIIDGPSLMYYLLKEDSAWETTDRAWDESKISHTDWKQTNVQLPPDRLISRTTNFLTCLVEVASAVHVVMDGVPPKAKLSTQLARQKVVAANADEIARGGQPRRRHTIPHILSEWAMIEAISEFASIESRVTLHRPQHGEAESYIDYFLRDQDNNAVVFSNDTDFLIYPHCLGFIPFQTLQFQNLNGSRHLSGFHYLGSKFYKVYFPPRSVPEQSRILSAVAALAGSDYGCSELEAARTQIIQSDVGRLRVKYQNNPTGAMTLVAVVRFVSHCILKEPQDWMNGLLRELQAANLGPFLDSVHNTYFQPPFSQSTLTTTFVETTRLLEGNVFICRPLIETWREGKNRQSPSPQKEPKKRPGKGRKKNRKKRGTRQNSTLTKDVASGAKTQEMIECLDVLQFPPSECQTRDWSNASFWEIPHFCFVRQRIYSLIQQTSAVPGVRECRRTGCGENVSFAEYFCIPSLLVDAKDCNSTEELYCHCVYLCTGSMELAKAPSEHYAVNCTQEPTVLSSPTLQRYGITLLACLMMPPRIAFLSLLVSTAPGGEHRFMKEHTTTKSPPLELSNCVALAFFHALLLHDAVTSTLVSPIKLDTSIQKSFHHNLTTLIWNEIQTHPDAEGINTICDRFFDLLREHAANEEQAIIQEWEEQSRFLLNHLPHSSRQ